jgi:hypothetical protein
MTNNGTIVLLFNGAASLGIERIFLEIFEGT